MKTCGPCTYLIDLISSEIHKSSSFQQLLLYSGLLLLTLARWVYIVFKYFQSVDEHMLLVIPICLDLVSSCMRLDPEAHSRKAPNPFQPPIRIQSKGPKCNKIKIKSLEISLHKRSIRVGFPATTLSPFIPSRPTLLDNMCINCRFNGECKGITLIKINSLLFGKVFCWINQRNYSAEK